MVALTKRLFKGLLLALFGFFTASGCVYLGVGALGAVGGYMISPDTVEGTLEGSFENIWLVSYAEVKRHGVIVQEDHMGGYILADADGTEVTVQITATGSTHSWKILVKARQNMFPKVRLAQMMYTNIHDAVSQ